MCIRESVDSLCRDGANAQYMQYFKQKVIPHSLTFQLTIQNTMHCPLQGHTHLFRPQNPVRQHEPQQLHKLVFQTGFLSATVDGTVRLLHFF